MHHRIAYYALALTGLCCRGLPAQAQRTIPMSPLALGTRIVTTGSTIRTQSRSARSRIVDTSTVFPTISSATALSALAPSAALELRLPESGIDLRLERNAAGDITKVVIVPEPPPAPPRTASESLSRARLMNGIDTASLRRYREQSRAQSVKSAVDLVLSILPLFEPPPLRGRRHEHALDVVVAHLDHPYTAYQRHIADRVSDSLDANRAPIIRVRDSISTRVITRSNVPTAEVRTVIASLDSLQGVRTGWRVARSSDVLDQSYCWQATLTGASQQGAPPQRTHRVALATSTSACASWISEARYRTDRRVADNARVRTMRAQQPGLLSRAFADTPGLRDSILRVFATPQPDRVRDLLVRALGTFSSPAPSLATLHRLALRGGDSGWVASHLTRSEYENNAVVTPELWPIVERFLRDDEYAFRHGVRRAGISERILSSLLVHPPSNGSSPDTDICTPTVCRAMAAHYRSDSGDPLAIVGLAAHVLLDPRVWSDSLEQFARRTNAVDLLATMMGGSSSFSRLRPPPVPAFDADWREWMRWRWELSGETPTETFGTTPVPRPSQRRVDIFAAPSGIFSSRVVAVPLQWKALRSGRNVSDVMRRRLAAAVTDSERVVFTSLLIELGAIRDSASRVAELLDATDRVDAFRGYAQLQRLEQESTPAQSDSTGQAVLQRIVSGVLDRVGRQRRDVDSTQRGQGLPPMRYAVSIDGLTLAMRRQLADAGVEMVPARFREGEHDAIDRVTVTVRQRGLLYFVSETYGSRSFYARSGYWMTTDSGESYILVSTPSGFRVIKRQSWIA